MTYLLIICISSLMFVVSTLVLADSYTEEQAELESSEDYDELCESMDSKQNFWIFMGSLSFVTLILALTYAAVMFVKGLL